MKIFAIGDIHGMFNVYMKAREWIETQMEPEDHVVFLGDLIDRGPESALVVKSVREWEPVGTKHVVMGNHEMFMWDSGLEDSWMMNGGRETLFSYQQLYTDSKAEREAFLSDVVWMKNLPYYVTFGDNHEVICVHSNFLPVYLEGENTPEQKDTMLWSRNYMNVPVPGAVVVHGHTPISKEPYHRVIIQTFLSKDGELRVDEGRLNIDGGAVFGGKLCVAVFDDLRCVEVKTFD